MKHGRSVLTLAAFALVAFVSTAGAREKYEEKFTKTVPIPADGKVLVSNVSGDVVVRTWEKNEVKVDALKISTASSTERAKERAAEVEINVGKTDGILRIEVDYPSGGHRDHEDSGGVSIDFDIMIPAKASIEARSVSGDVTVTAVGGSLQAETVSGDVTVSRAMNGAEAKTVSGDVEVSDVTGAVWAEAVSGNAVLTRIDGSIEVESVSGEIELRDVTGAKTIKAKCLSGDLLYAGRIAKGGRYDFESHSGEIVLRLPADSAFDLDCETFSGEITTGFELKVFGKVTPKRLRGVANGGGATLTCQAFSGDIEIEKQ